MRYTGKVVGGLIGMFLGPLGAVAGVLLGHQVDEHLDGRRRGCPAPEELAAIGERFFRATFRVMGYLAKADGRVSEQEISAARAVMAELRLDSARVQQAIDCFTAGKQPGFDLAAELAELGARLRRPARPRARLRRDPGARRAERQQPRRSGAAAA